MTKVPTEFTDWPEGNDDPHMPMMDARPMETMFGHTDEEGNRVPLEEFNEQDAYMKDIEPLVIKLHELCIEHEIPMVVMALFRRHRIGEIDPEATTGMVGEGVHVVYSGMESPRAGYIQRAIVIMAEHPDEFMVVPVSSTSFNHK